MSMSMNVSVHHPEVQKGELGVHRINSGEPNQLVVTFNSSDRYGGVTLFVSDAEWNAIVDQVAAFRATEERITEFDCRPRRTAPLACVPGMRTRLHAG